MAIIVKDKNYCRRCRKYNISLENRTNYCQICKNLMIKKEKNINRWSSSSEFVKTSFIDCVDKDFWHGFTDIKYSKKLINILCNKFSEITHLISTSEKQKLKTYNKGNFLYLVSDGNKELLKVGQTQNVLSRLNHYYNISEYKPINYDIFITETYEQQDLYEEKIRNYLEYLGYKLPFDNTGLRLKYIERSYV